MPDFRLSKIISPAYFGLWRSDKQNEVIGGSKGSGKSFFAALKIVYNIMRNPYLNVLVVRKVGETIRDSCYADLLKIINTFFDPEEWTHTYSPMEIRYKRTNQKVLFRGLDNPYKLASITADNGGYLAWVWFEEAFDITDYGDILKVQGSIRAIPPETGLSKKFIYTFNPWGPDHWLKTEYFDKQRDDTIAVITTYLDNPGITEEDREWYEQLKVLNPRAAEVICYGRWGRAEGLIYDNWAELDFDYTEILKRPGTKAIYGLDFGYKTSYNAFIAAVADVQKHEMYVFDEIYSKGMTNLDIAKVITQAGYAGERIIADSAEPKSIDELRTGRGLVEEVIDQATGEVRYDKYRLPNIMPAVKGPDSVRNGIARLQEFTIYIHPKCKNFKSEIQLYAYKVDKNGKLTGEPEKEFDHACLVGDTLVFTEAGQVPLKDIKVGMKVMTRLGWKKVTDWALTKKDAEIYRLETDDGHFIEGTADHKVITTKGIKQIKDISSSDEVIVCQAGDQVEQIIQMRNMSNMMGCYGTDIQNQIKDQSVNTSYVTTSGYTDMFGKSITDQSQRDTMSIISTVTAGTMISPTFNYCLQRIMFMNILQPMNSENIVPKECREIQSYKINAEPGIDPKRGVNGIRNMPGRICGKKRNSFVNTVVKNLRHRIQGKIDSAQIIANKGGDTIPGRMVKQEFVKDVAKNSSPINMGADGFVPIHVRHVIKVNKRTDVFNITVEDAHEYLANGILVKNCDALRYCTSALFQMGHTKVVEAKGVNVIEGSLGKEEAPAEPAPKPRHTRVCSTHGSDEGNPVPSLFRFF